MAFHTTYRKIQTPISLKSPMWSDSSGASCPPSLPFPARPRHSAILVFPQTCLLWGLHATLPLPESYSAKSVWLTPSFHWALSFNVTFSEKASFYTLSRSLHWLLVIALYYLYIHLPIISLLTIWWSVSIFVWHYIGLMYFSNYYFVYLYKFMSSKQAQNPIVPN